MIKFLRELVCVVKNYRRERSELQRSILDCEGKISTLRVRCSEMEEALQHMLVEHYDVEHDSACTVVLIGRFHNRDYVRIEHVGQQSFNEFVGMLQAHARGAQLGRIDAPPTFSADITYAKELVKRHS